MEALELEPDLIRWTASFTTDRQVKLVLDGEKGEPNPVDAGIPQGSPAAPILFVTHLSGIFDEVERAVPGIKGLSFADDIGILLGGRKEKTRKRWQESWQRRQRCLWTGRRTMEWHSSTERQKQLFSRRAELL
jgi:hypothetical protein